MKVAAYKGSLKSTLALFGAALRQHPDDFREMLEAAPWKEAEIEGAGSCEPSPSRVSPLSPAESWRILEGRRWWAMERSSMLAVFAHNLVLELMALHRTRGGVTEELQWVCKNLGQFVRQHADLKGPVVAGLALAVEDRDAQRSHLPEYLLEMLEEGVGMELDDPAPDTL